MQTNRGTCVDFSKADFNLQNYITKSKKRLQAILKRLQWSEELVLKHCSDKSNAAATLSDGEAEPSLPASFSTNNSLVIAEDALRAIVADPKAEIPQRFSDLQRNFSRQQKLQIYEHVVQNTEKLLEPELTVPINDESHGSMTFAEIVAIKKREKKQKRRKYRTSKPTHIEEVRNLVELQMQALEQYLHPEKATASRLSNRERDFKQQQYRGRSTLKDKERKSATHEDESDSGRRERRNISAYRRRNASRPRSTSANKNHQKLEKEHLKHGSGSRYQDHKRRSRSHRHSTSRERRQSNSLKQKTYRSSSRERRHRSRSKERRHRSRSRSKEGRRYKKHRSRSKDKIHRSRSKERRHKKSRSRSRSNNKKRSRDRRNNTRSKSRSYEKKRQKEHYHKHSDYEAKSRNYEKDRHKDSRYIEKSKQDNRRTNGISKKYDNSLTEVQHKTKEKTQTQNRRDRDTCSDSYKRDEIYTNSTQNINETLEPIIKRQSNEELMDTKNNGLTSHYIKLEIKTDPDNKAQVLEDIKMKEEPH